MILFQLVKQSQVKKKPENQIVNLWAGNANPCIGKTIITVNIV